MKNILWLLFFHNENYYIFISCYDDDNNLNEKNFDIIFISITFAISIKNIFLISIYFNMQENYSIKMKYSEIFENRSKLCIHL